MKKILFSLFIFLGVSVYAQTNSSQNIYKLEQDVKTSLKDQSSKNITSSFYQPAKKNAGLAIIYSLLLPGMGELYADSYSSGKYFTIAEAALWGVYAGVNSYSNWKKDSYKSYAASVAGVNPAGKDADFYATIGEYIDVNQYNDEKSLERNFDQMYNLQTDSWDWKTNDIRKNYRNMWVSSEQAHNNLRFVVGALLLNRLASAINAARLVAAYNKRQSVETSWNVSFGVRQQLTLPTTLTMNFVTTF